MLVQQLSVPGQRLCYLLGGSPAMTSLFKAGGGEGRVVGVMVFARVTTSGEWFPQCLGRAVATDTLCAPIPGNDLAPMTLTWETKTPPS